MRAFEIGTMLLMGLALSACSGDGEDGAAELACEASQLRYSGKLDDRQFDITRVVGNYRFENKLSASPGRLVASWSTQTVGDWQLEISFDQLLANGESGPARGWLGDPDEALEVGNCETGELVSTLSMDGDGDGAHFVLSGLRTGQPFCTGPLHVGELRGCIGFSE